MYVYIYIYMYIYTYTYTEKKKIFSFLVILNIFSISDVLFTSPGASCDKTDPDSSGQKSISTIFWPFHDNVCHHQFFHFLVNPRFRTFVDPFRPWNLQ